MEAPPLSAPPIAAVAPPPAPQQTASHINYPDSVDSSPRSRNTDSWDEPPYGPTFPTNTTASTAKLRLMCSYGGHIFPRPNDKSLCYVGGDTRIVVVDRHSSLSDLQNRLSKTLLNGKSFALKYQLPNEDLDSLISVTTDEDVENMVDEYDRLHNSSGSSNSATKNSRLRLFLFPTSVDSETSSSIESLMENSSKSHDWFVNALNWNSSACKVRAFSDTSSVNCLLGLDDSIENPASKDEAQLEASLSMKSGGGGGGGGGGKPNSNLNSNVAQDVHSVPDSPMLETSSSFGSTSSSPSMSNLPPIKVHVEEGNNNQKGVAGLGIEESFQHMNIVGGGFGPNNVLKQEDGGFVMAAPAAVPAGAMVAGLPMVVGGEFQNRVFSDDERSEHGVQVGFRKQLQAQPQLQQQQPQQLSQLTQQQTLQLQQQQQQQGSHLQQAKQAGSFDLPSPDSVSSEGSVTNPLSRQKPLMYQEPLVQIQSGNSRALANQMDPKASDSNSRMQMQQQVQESGYVLPNQFDQYQQLHQPQHFVPAGAQYIHHHPPGAVPFYYSIYPSQQISHPPAIEHQYPVYYVPARQTQAYNMPVQQPGFNDSSPTAHSSRPQTPPTGVAPPSTVYNHATSAAAGKPEMSTGAYRTSAAAPPQLVQVSSAQSSQQYAGFSQIHHPSQSIAPSAATANYGYEFTDPTHAQIYYTQPLAPQLAAQYQTMTSSPAVMLPEASSHLPSENIKQARTPQQ